MLKAEPNCTGCGGGPAVCPVGALSLKSEIDQHRCNRCASCIPACPRQSLVPG